MEINDKAQIHTLEGFVAAVLMIMTLILITKSALIVTPQSELHRLHTMRWQYLIWHQTLQFNST